jgi:hypothetical protein
MGPEMMAAQLAMQMGGQAQQQMINQGLSIYDYINASKQLKAGKEAQKNLGARPMISTPKAQIEEENMARQMAYSNMPGYQQMIDNATAGAGSSLTAMKQAGGSIADLLGGVVNVNQNLNNALSDIELQNLATREANLKNLQSTIGQRSQYELLQQRDKQAYYNQKKAGIDALIAAGTKGKDQAIKGYFGGMNQNTAFNSQMGQNMLSNPEMMAALGMV